jgi:hypothetical protein
MEQLITHQLKLISLHVPKTGGTSFATILKDVYGHQRVSPFHINKSGEKGEVKLRVNDHLFTQQTLPAITQVAHGHFKYCYLEERVDLPPTLPIITWLRDPVDRVISAYQYASKIYSQEVSSTHPRLNILNTLKRSLMEYAHGKVNRNLMTAYLEGKSLEDFFFVGILEHFEEDLAYLAKKLGWQNYHIPHLNQTTKRPPLPEFKRDAIRQWNAKDQQLYDLALELRAQRPPLE